MFEKDRLDAVEEKRREWEAGTLKKSLGRFKVEESPQRFCTPVDIKDHDFLENVGFPGEYPYTASTYAFIIPTTADVTGGAGGGLVRAQVYSGYGAPEDTRDYYKQMASQGWLGGPNIAFDLPTQCGYDSDNPISRGEVGKTGVAIDSLLDFEIIYEAFTGDRDLDKITSAWTINAPANIILAMYIALADGRGIPQDKLRGTPQNDILKEFVARGTYIFPPKPSMRMVRDTITYCTEQMPLMNTINICGYHMREAGATAPQVLGFTFANAIAYTQLGVDAGLDVDAFLPRFSFLQFSGSMEIFKEIALQRAARRMWARITKERFGAKNQRSWLLRPRNWAQSGEFTKVVQRPLNNLTRCVLSGVAEALSGGNGYCGFPYDEPLGLGHSLEGWQLNLDAQRIIQHEAKLCDVTDPLAGSYYVESLTDEIEAEAWSIIQKVDEMGGAAAAIERGYYQQEISRSAYQYQRGLETGERVIVGVNRFTGESELDIEVSRVVPYPYDAAQRAEAERKQTSKLNKLRKERDNGQVAASLGRLEEAAGDEGVNLIPPILEAVKAYATVGETCNSLKKVFGEYQEQGSEIY